MLKKIIPVLSLLYFVFDSLVLNAQPTPYYYYYEGQQKSVLLSDTFFFVKFRPGLTALQKLDMINTADVVIVPPMTTNIPDVIELKSKIKLLQYLHYPCDTTTQRTGVAVNKPEPCPTCPPNCDPYWVNYYYNNMQQAIFYFENNSDVVSVSKSVYVVNSYTRNGTCEDFYIKIKQGFSMTDFQQLINTHQLSYQDVSNVLGSNIYRITDTRIGSGSLLNKANLFFETGKCDFSTPNFYRPKILMSNDPDYWKQWGLKNTGTNQGSVSGGIAEADIRIEDAWPISKGQNIKVAIVDLGVQLDHPDLNSNLLQGIDATFQGTNGAPVGTGREYNHGTLMAGIIGAVADNGIGIAGVAPLCKIIPINGFRDYRTGNDVDLSTAIRIAANNVNADVINCSWSGGEPSDLLTLAIRDAATNGRSGKGCIIVFSAGQLDQTNFIAPVNYPSSLPEVIAVGGLTPCNQRIITWGDPILFSTCNLSISLNTFFGPELDMAAPGTLIQTLSNEGNSTQDCNGTSPSAAFVSGVAALVLSIKPTLVKADVEKILGYSCNRVGQYCYNWTPAHPNGPWNEELGYGRINAKNAVELALKASSFSDPVYNVSAQASTLTNSNYFTLSAPSPACPVNFSGVYAFRRYEVTKAIAFPNTTNPLIICNSNGWSAANPNNAQNFAIATDITNTTAVLKTYVYQGYNILGQNLGYFPASPDNVKFNYTVIGGTSSIDYQNGRINSNVHARMDYDFNYQFVYNDSVISFPEKKLSERLLKSSNIIPNPAYSSITFEVNAEEFHASIYSNFGVKVKER
jgi:hypothetical protein